MNKQKKNPSQFFPCQGRGRAKAFTLVELVIVIVILAILGAIAFISLSGYSTQARDSARISDISSIRTSIELFHLDAGKYPIPTNAIDVNYSGSIVVWKQGTFGESAFTNTNKLDKIPVDPLVEKLYTYSVTSKGNEFQLGGIMEGDQIVINPSQPSLILGKGLLQVNAGDVEARAYVAGNYNGIMTKVNSGTTCEILSVPSIISNDSSMTDLEVIVDNDAFVYGGYKNLPSSFRDSKFKYNAGFNFHANKLVAYTDTGSCEPLLDRTIHGPKIKLIKGLQDSYIGTNIQNDGAINNIVNEDINLINPSPDSVNTAINTVNNTLGGDIVITNVVKLPSCVNQPIYTNAIYNNGTPTQLYQQWQSTDSNEPCYWTCGAGKVLQGTDCLSSTASGTPPNGTSEISNSTSLVGGTWHYSVTPGVATYTCNTGYTWNGSSCIANTYSISGSFGANGAGATVNVCGVNTTADGSGNFTANRSYGSTCNNIVATRTGYNCTTTTDGPITLGGNLSNISGSCSIISYNVAGSFGVNAAGASVNVCGTNIVANSSGGFSTSIQYGSNCSNISATKSSYDCTTTINGPASLTSNISNITGSCTGTNYLSLCGGTGQIKYIIGGVVTTSSAGITCDDDIIACSGVASGYIVSACNVGSSTPGTTSASYGNYFQRGRNKGFVNGDTSMRSTVLPGSVGLNAATDTYGFVWNSNTNDNNINFWHYWSTDNINDNWGSVTNTNLARKGPCNTGYHVPLDSEWTSVASAIGSTANVYSYLMLGKGGYRNSNYTGYTNQGVSGYYWTSVVQSINARSRYNSASYFHTWSTGRNLGLNVRCFKN